MKHVFIVDSHTTFLSSLGVINFLHLLDSDVVLLYGRNYSNSLYHINYKTVNVDELYYSTAEVFSSTDRKVINDFVERVDYLIQSEIHGNFHLYAMNFHNPLVCLLYSSTKCKRISFIQESAQSTVKAYRKDISLWKGVKRRVKLFLTGVPYRKWISPCYYRNDYIWKQDKMYTYALNDTIFSGLDAENRIISWPISSTKIEIDTNATFFICDGWVRHEMCESEIFMSMMQRLVEQNASSHNYIRFHPNQIESERNAIIHFFEDNKFCYEIMDTSIPFEVILSSYRGLNIVGMGSALCFFAKDLHHNVICHDDWLYENSDLFRHHIDITGNKLFNDY